jgi:hypothetical protein
MLNNNLTVSNGTKTNGSNYGTGYFDIKKQGKEVKLNVLYNRTSGDVTYQDIIATLDTDYRPITSQYVPAIIRNSSNGAIEKAQITISSSTGEIKMISSGKTGYNSININCSFFTV